MARVVTFDDGGKRLSASYGEPVGYDLPLASHRRLEPS